MTTISYQSLERGFKSLLEDMEGKDGEELLNQIEQTVYKSVPKYVNDDEEFVKARNLEIELFEYFSELRPWNNRLESVLTEYNIEFWVAEGSRLIQLALMKDCSEYLTKQNWMKMVGKAHWTIEGDLKNCKNMPREIFEGKIYGGEVNSRIQAIQIYPITKEDRDKLLDEKEIEIVIAALNRDDIRMLPEQYEQIMKRGKNRLIMKSVKRGDFELKSRLSVGILENTIRNTRDKEAEILWGQIRPRIIAKMEQAELVKSTTAISKQIGESL